MNREIKFRAWNGSNLLSWEWISAMGMIESVIINRDGYYILMQYTGIKDNKGKDIYEGDIVYLSKSEKAWHSLNDWKGVVEFDNSLQYVVSKKSDWIDLANPQYLPEASGNVFENPELLTPVK